MWIDDGIPDGHVDSSSDERTVNNTVRHTYRVLDEKEKASMMTIKDKGQDFIDYVDKFVPKGREASIAKTKMEEAVMWAVKGITQ